jgi:hypothetical protein
VARVANRYVTAAKLLNVAKSLTLSTSQHDSPHFLDNDPNWLFPKSVDFALCVTNDKGANHQVNENEQLKPVHFVHKTPPWF